MEGIFIVLITPLQEGENSNVVCDCSVYYGCRIKGALLAGYMDGTMTVISGLGSNE